MLKLTEMFAQKCAEIGLQNPEVHQSEKGGVRFRAESPKFKDKLVVYFPWEHALKQVVDEMEALLATRQTFPFPRTEGVQAVWVAEGEVL